MTNEKRLEIEKRIIRRYVKAVLAAGYMISVDDGEETFPCTTVTEAIAGITAVDVAHLYARNAEGKQSWLFFVMGNLPGEVLNDYSTDLEDIIAPVNDYAEQYA